MKQLFIIHGYQAGVQSHWFQWLSDKMKSYGYNTNIVYLPNSKNPSFDDWQNALKENLTGNLNQNTVIVAHSLGVITTLNYLSKINNMPLIKGLFLISGFIDKLENLPELDDFIEQCEINPNKIHSRHIYSIAAIHDPIVNITASNQVSQCFGIRTHSINHVGHFLDNEGYKTFNELFEQILKII